MTLLLQGASLWCSPHSPINHANMKNVPEFKIDKWSESPRPLFKTSVEADPELSPGECGGSLFSRGGTAWLMALSSKAEGTNRSPWFVVTPGAKGCQPSADQIRIQRLRPVPVPASTAPGRRLGARHADRRKEKRYPGGRVQADGEGMYRR